MQLRSALMTGVARRTIFEPALTLSPEVVAWINDIAASRGPFQSRVGDKPLSVSMEGLVWQHESSAIPMFDCVWDLGGETVVLSLSRPLVEALVSTVQSGLAFPTEPTASLILELALEPLIARLEDKTNRTLHLLRVGKAITLAPYVELEIVIGPVSGKGRLFLFSPLDGLVPFAFRALAELLAQLPRQPRELSPELPVIIAGEIGTLRASAALLRKASVGDALLPDISPFGRGQIALSVGQLWTRADLEGDHLVLRGPFRPQSRPLECAHMTEIESQLRPSDADLDDIEIVLVFECGRWPISLGELRSAGDGHVFELGRPIDGLVDIVANGRCIGRGDIVRIGDDLGIRLRGRLACND
ncbi:component RhcQ of type III secretion apparatus (plasmid) [Sinorhizobium fredii NGR234]|uniref:Probable translocation protein Y4yK n=2 Tax=Rhizobium fredii TaxID=380 RepID=Y4YK_SINFN|nr:RecName: Full=Probable translocation protein Y4yK [Sinorhizobium fredii NGR234]AAB91950.1 component RhcQ of type III secretion apparatus [Sinorhizobium fredii NGR234]